MRAAEPFINKKAINGRPFQCHGIVKCECVRGVFGIAHGPPELLDASVLHLSK